MSTDHSGSSTSQASAPSRARRRGDALIYLGLVGEQGATWRDLADYLDVHHGAASSVLSVLHREGKVARLTEARNGCHVYVLPEEVSGRETQPYGGRAITMTAMSNMLRDVRALHTRYGPGEETFCSHDGKPWPCPTAVAVGKS